MHAAVQDDLNAADNSQVCLPLLEVGHGVVHCNEGRRAGRVDRFCRPHEAQHKRDPPAGSIQVSAAESIK